VQDRGIRDHIDDLVNEEHQLLNRGEDNPLDPAERERLHRIEVELDQCWDLLRQRRARREFGGDPDAARVRDPNTVERYQQ
jgi:hypothetical protein